VTESRQVDNTTNILRLMMLLALAIGIILTRTLLRDRRTRWQQSPFLLTASRTVKEDKEKEQEEAAAASTETEKER
jgi:membrane protein